jgi:alkyldihydroxyacetonephosphate synthase
MRQSSASFLPSWIETPPPATSYRSLFKWGDPAHFKHPNRGLYEYLKKALQMSDEDFKQPCHHGLEPLEQELPPRLTANHLAALQSIVGVKNTHLDTYSRLRASYGKAMFDLIRLRCHQVENLPDIVLDPRHTTDIEQIVRYCNEQRIPLYVRGGGSSVTRGTESVYGGVMLDMSVHMNRVVDFSETDQTITVQAGMSGPELERILNHASETLNAQRAYTCGHFPQSFEYSSVGGWVVTRGAGQNSTYYGKIEDMVLAQEYVTPRGILHTPAYPRQATGPDFNQIMLGSEGCFGILTTVTLKVFRYLPQNCRRFSYLFKTWQEALTATRQIMQSEDGRPSIFRLSDPEETDVALHMYHIANTSVDRILQALGYHPMQRCLLLGSCDGGAGYTRNLYHQIHTICRQQSALPLTPFRVTERWKRDRFRDPYLREDLQDFGIIIDTLECAVRWSQMESVHEAVRKFIKSHPNTICMAHLSHAYPQGGNLYFIFIARMDDPNKYLRLQYGILDVFQRSGAALSHHHGIGKIVAPWLEEHLGSVQMDALRALKGYFDPERILNPGGTLGFDLSDEQRRKRWGMRS